jgi:hypothetical protein
MSEYNTKNYMEQGGDKWVIGGELVFDKSAEGVLPNLPTPASDANAAAVRSSLISLITAMKDYGLITGDDFTMTYAAVTNDNEATRAANTAKITSVDIDDGEITITLSKKVSELNDFDARNGWGVHKWLGIGISAGVTPITDLTYNGSEITAEDVTEATNMGLSAGYFVRWVAADLVLAGDNSQKSKDTFVLWSSGYKQTEFKLKIVEPTE